LQLLDETSILKMGSLHYAMNQAVEQALIGGLLKLRTILFRQIVEERQDMVMYPESQDTRSVFGHEPVALSKAREVDVVPSGVAFGAEIGENILPDEAHALCAHSDPREARILLCHALDRFGRGSEQVGYLVVGQKFLFVVYCPLCYHLCPFRCWVCRCAMDYRQIPKTCQAKYRISEKKY